MICSDYTQSPPCVLMPSISRLFTFFIYPCHVFVSVSLISPPTYFLSKKIYRLQIISPTFFAHFWEECTHIEEKCLYFGKSTLSSRFCFSFIDFPFSAHMFSPSKSIWECHIARDLIWVSLYFSLYLYLSLSTTAPNDLYISSSLLPLRLHSLSSLFFTQFFIASKSCFFSSSVSIISSRTWLVDRWGFIF